MKNLHGKTLQEGVDNLLTMRKYKPYEYGGEWFCTIIDGQVKAYRSMKPIQKKAYTLKQNLNVMVVS